MSANPIDEAVRARFEAWAELPLDRDADGEYLRLPVKLAWAAWQAALTAALTQQPEARGVVRHDLCGCPNGRAEHSPSCAALTGERNA